MTARVDSLDNTNGWAKAGVVLRNDLTDDGSSAGYAAVVVTPSNGVSFQRDSNADGYLDELTSTAATVKAPVWLRLTRTATQVSAYYSTDGSTFTQVGSKVTLPSMATTQDAGVIHTAHSTTAGSATFSNLRIVTSPYKAYSSIPAAVSQSGGVTSLTGAGIDIWRSGTAYDDEYSAAYRTGAAGTSSTVTVRVASQDKTNSWAKAGVMLRNNIASAGSSTGYLVLATTPGNGIALSSDSNGDGYLDTNTIKTGSATVALSGSAWSGTARRSPAPTRRWHHLDHRRNRDTDRGEQHPGRGHVLHGPRRKYRHRDLQPVLRQLTSGSGHDLRNEFRVPVQPPHRHAERRHAGNPVSPSPTRGQAAHDVALQHDEEDEDGMTASRRGGNTFV
ncbi:hypothetical protein GCM10011428_78870 [Streptomyces violaceus]|uniref:hypothetical protein n=1 Tax=Streptomyces violaceus TaxID=1936 RepID=UPI0031E5E8A0